METKLLPRIQILAALCFIALLSCPPTPAHGQLYTIANLGRLPGSIPFEATALNNSGQIVGFSLNGNSFQAFQDSGGIFTALNTLGESESVPTSINDVGQVVGRVDNGYFASYTPFLYSGGAMTVLPTPGGVPGEATGIDHAGQVVGWTYSTGVGYHAFLYSGGTMSDLNSLASSSTLTLNEAEGINASGQIVGDATNVGGFDQAFVYSAGAVTDLGTFGGDNSFALGINNAGQVVGYAQTAGDAAYDIFLYSGGIMTDLGTYGAQLPDAYLSINNEGQVVGNSFSNHFIYSGGTTINLSSLLAASHWTPLFNIAINDSGQIVGFGDGPQRESSFLLTPTVPEPATLMLLTLSAAGLLGRRRSGRGPPENDMIRFA